MLDRLWRLLIILTGICVCLLLLARVAGTVVLAPCVLHGELKCDGGDGTERGAGGKRWDGAGAGEKDGQI